MSDKKMQLTGIVLAGGQSRRIGATKALMPWGKGNLIEHIVEVMKRMFPINLVMVKRPEEFLFLEKPGIKVLKDLTGESYPLGGIYSGLYYTETPFAYICGCDMPYIKPELVKALWKLCEGYDATVPVWDDRPQPLCGIYSRDCLESIKTAIDKEQYAVQKLLRSIRTRFVQKEEVMRVDPEGRSFLDIDTLEDYQRTKRMGVRENRSNAD
jgi:molybdopterin-guanine dinucleotide biosynthesis protein A